jgi:hypothetical protein
LKQEQLTYVVENQLEFCRATLDLKNREYASDKDALTNFKRAAALRGVTPAQALAGMMSKHTVSIYDMIGADDPVNDYALDVWNEKITDHINYLLLLKAIVVEDRAYSNPLKFDFEEKDSPE